MKIYFTDQCYGGYYLANANYVYKKEKLDDGKWGITEITYGLAKVIPLEEGETEKHGRVAVTEDERPILEKLKNADEYRLRKESKSRKEVLSVTSLEDWHKEEQSAEDDDPCFTWLERESVRDELENSVDMLTPKQQQVIRLKYFDEYSTVIIAEIMGVTVSAVSHLEGRALKKLKEILDKRQLIA